MKWLGREVKRLPPYRPKENKVIIPEVVTAVQELYRDKEVVQELRAQLAMELIDRDYVRALADREKISQIELISILK